MLGFDALGRLALGQYSSGASNVQALVGLIGARSRLAGAGSFTGVLAAKSEVMTSSRGLPVFTGFVYTISKSLSSLRAPGGVVLKGIVNAQAKTRNSPGILISARLSTMSYGVGSAHVQVAVNATRRPLMLDGSQPVVSSYWKGSA